MRRRAILLLLLGVAAFSGATAAAGAPIPMTFGRGIRTLQELVDERYGQNRIDVTKDFIGARTGDIDPWFWVGDPGGAVRITVVRRNNDRDRVGWYEESGGQARIPDDGGVLFSGAVQSQEEAVVPLPGFRIRFGFYVEGSAGPGTGAKLFFTNRKLNDCGPDGTGAVHAPLDGDVQALMYDVSRWAGPDTWLVCFEDHDTGGALMAGGDASYDDRKKTNPKCRRPRDEVVEGPGSPGSWWLDSDYSDVVFEVKAEGATPARGITFGRLKLLYR